jgi:hypothetical protein
MTNSWMRWAVHRSKSFSSQGAEAVFGMENDRKDFMKNRERFWTQIAKPGEPTPSVSAIESAS